MSIVHVPFGDNPSETATLLLAAAEEGKYEASVVGTDTFAGTFTVPEEIAKAAGLDAIDPEAEFQAEVDAIKDTELDSQPVTDSDVEAKGHARDAAKDGVAEPPVKKAAPAKKAAAKKAPAKKAAAKKSTAKGK